MKSIFFIINSIAEDYSIGSEKQKYEQTQKLFETVYFNLNYFGLFLDEDERSDFLLWLYPKFEDFFKRYRKESSGFFTFLRMNLKYNYLSFLRNKRRKSSLDSAIDGEESYNVCVQLYDMYDNDKFDYYAAEPQAPYYAKEETEGETFSSNFCEKAYKKLGNNNLNKQLFLLSCKTCFFITEDLVYSIANKIGLTFDCLNKVIEIFKKKNSKIETALKKKTDNRNKFYIMIKSCENRIMYGNLPDWERQYTEKLFYNNKSKFIKLQNKKVQSMPSNRSIAAVLNISRGAVDSNLAKIMKSVYTSPHEDIFSIGKRTQKKRISRAFV